MRSDFGDAVADFYDLDVAVGFAADAFIAVLAEDERLAMFKLQDVFAAGFALGKRKPRAIVEDVAVLQNLDEGRALVRSGMLQGVFQVPWKTSTERATKVASAPIASDTGLNGRSSEPNGVDLVFLLNSEVGEYWPLVSP